MATINYYPAAGGGGTSDGVTIDGDGTVGDPFTLADPWTVVGPTVGDVDDVTIASGISGDADAAAGVIGYEVLGYPAVTIGSETYYLRPNNVDTNTFSITNITTAASVSQTSGSNLLLTDANAGNSPVFTCYIDADSALKRQFRAFGGRGTITSGAEYKSSGGMHTAGGDITSLVIHSTSADGIKAGSVFLWRKVR